MSPRLRGCVRLASAPACSRWNRRWTSSHAIASSSIELRILNEPKLDPETGLPFSSRGLVACLREGAQRFGWQLRDPRPCIRFDGRWLIGTGVAASTYPTRRRPSTAIARVDREGRYSVLIDASD